MMSDKKICLTIVLVYSYLLGISQEVILTSKVESATMYFNGAFVKRKAQTTLLKGKTKILLDEIPSSSDINSIQISADENTKILSVKPILSTKTNNSEI